MILVDAGPLIAIMRANDQHHAACTRALKRIKQPMGTVWPVVTEAIYLLGGLPKAQDAIWEMLLENAVQLLPVGLDDIPRIRELMHKFSDRPMELADASLIRVAERENIRHFFTVDRQDFSIYRLYDKIRPVIIP